MTAIQISVGGLEFRARFEEERAPDTCDAFRTMLPKQGDLLHARWSGEACWIPLQDLDLDLGFENHTSFPAPGQVLFYPGPYSETEILFPYGGTRFASIVGQLAGNHFLTIESSPESLRGLGMKCLWEGAQTITFDV